MTDTIERMARAMNTEGDKVYRQDGRLMMDTTHISAVNLSAMARAALSALEEPSEAQLYAAHKAAKPYFDRGETVHAIRHALQAMIRTAQEGTS